MVRILKLLTGQQMKILLFICIVTLLCKIYQGIEWSPHDSEVGYMFGRGVLQFEEYGSTKPDYTDSFITRRRSVSEDGRRKQAESNMSNDNLADFEMNSSSENKDEVKDPLLEPPSSINRWMAEREIEYRRRQSVIKSVCDKFRVSSNTSQSPVTDLINKATHMDKNHLVERVRPDQFYLSRPHRTLACLINKVASSSVVKTFLHLEGVDTSKIQSPHAYGSKLHPKSMKEVGFTGSHYLRFVMVREPMERLVSCYKDKMVTNTHWSLKNFRQQVKDRVKAILQKRNLLKSRSNRSQSSERQGSKSFNVASRFWGSQEERGRNNWSQHIKGDNNTKSLSGSNLPAKLGANASKFETTKMRLDKMEKIGAAAVVPAPRNIKETPKPEDIPSFEEFLEYILSTDLLGSGFESHWVPFWRACTPCHFQYDVVAKLETGEDDFSYIWKASGLDHVAPIPWENDGGSSKSSDNKKQKELADFYSSIPRELILRVYNRYRLDYELFEYDINNVLKMAGYPLVTKKAKP